MFPKHYYSAAISHIRYAAGAVCAVCLLSTVTACTKSISEPSAAEVPATHAAEQTQAGVQSSAPLPAKADARSMRMSDSPVRPDTIDELLFRKDCVYIDVRAPDAFYKEGHIAGFINLPFYDYIAGFPGNKKALFQMTRQGGAYLGDAGTFVPNYEESAGVLCDMLDRTKYIIAISTAGVESCYFLNLLMQLGYEPERLYNAGSFTNGMGNDIAYRTYEHARYLVSGMELYNTGIRFEPDGLTGRP